MRLKGTAREWRFLAPFNAEVAVGRAPLPGAAGKPLDFPLDQAPDVIRPAPDKSEWRISFKEANRILADPKDGLVNYPIRGSGSYHLRVKGVRLYGSGGQVIAETKIQFNPPINFSGKPSLMTIYFRGTPEYDPIKELFY